MDVWIFWDDRIFGFFLLDWIFGFWGDWTRFLDFLDWTRFGGFLGFFALDWNFFLDWTRFLDLGIGLTFWIFVFLGGDWTGCLDFFYWN